MTPASVRQTIIEKMARYGFTPDMCADKSLDQLLKIVTITVQHRRYQGLLDADETIRLGEMEQLVAEARRVN